MAVFVSGFVVPETAAASIDMFAMWRQIRARLGHDEAAIADEMERIELARDLDRGTVSDVADHIEHIAAVAGVDAVGIGSDFDGTTLTPEGLENVSCFPAITAELLRRSWSEGDIRKLLGDNILRVMEAAESVAGSQ
jgi:membrane dipeptidase